MGNWARRVTAPGTCPQAIVSITRIPPVRIYIFHAARNGIAVARLHLNQDGYRGERINFPETETAILQVARSRGWEVDSRNWKADAPQLHYLKRIMGGSRRFYLSAGLHGDEPAPLLAILRLLETDHWPSNTDLYLCPALNPEGIILGTRTNSDGVDINRDYRQLRTREAHEHVEWLTNHAPFELCLCLHEDWEAHGFYLYELNPERRPSLAPAMIEAARKVCPIDDSPLIDGRETDGPGVIRPVFDPYARPEWPEAIWLSTHNSRHGYTLEAPSDWPLPVRVEVLIAAVQAGLHAWQAGLG